MNVRIVLRPVVLLAFLSGTLAPLRAGEWNHQLGGRWKHDQGRSDQHYVGPEYPGRWMLVEVGPDRIEVEQALGGVRDGFPTPGSGDETAVWSLPADGSVHEVTTGSMTRAMSAVWTDDGTLELRYTIPLDDEGELTGVERWRTIDDGSSLEIERSITFRGIEKTRRIVFRREPASAG